MTPTKKTTTSTSPKERSKRSDGTKGTRSNGGSRTASKSSSPKSKTQNSLKKNIETLTSDTKPTSKRQPSTKQVKKTGKSSGTIKFTRCKDITLFPHNSCPWRLEPRTKGKFNLSWFQDYSHAKKQIEQQKLKPKDYKLQCYISVPITDPLDGPIRTPRTVH